jgi:hypothetical protein
MDTALIAFLLDMAVKFTGLPAIPVEALPAFQPVSRAEMQRRICPEEAPGCGAIVALFDTDEYRILYLEQLDLDNPADNSFLIHEIVHVLQYHQKGEAIYADCSTLLHTEGQAYRAQNAYLRREGQLMRVGEVLRFTSCAGDRAVAARAAAGTTLDDPRLR